MNYEELTFGKTFVPYFVGIFLSFVIWLIIFFAEKTFLILWTQIKYTGTAKRKQTSTTNTSVNSQDNTLSGSVFYRKHR